jgi:DNA polymerase-4
MEKITLNQRDYAKLLKKRIKDELGLIASVGIAPNKFLAKLASDLDKPDGLVIIERGLEQSILRDMPIRRLWGVGKKTGEKLQALGFRTIGQIAQASLEELAKYLGKTLSYQLIELANGRDERKVEPERDIQSIGNEITFEQDLLQAAQVEKQFLALAEKVGWRLRLSGVKARTLTIKIRFASFQTITRSQSLLEPTNFDEVIYQMAVNLYRQVKVKESIRLLGITGSNLSLHEEESLFQEDQKKKALYQMMDDLKARFGESIITKANLIQPPE